MSGWRNQVRPPGPRTSTPAATASASAAVRRSGGAPVTAATSSTANSWPSSAAARNMSPAGSDRKPSRRRDGGAEGRRQLVPVGQQFGGSAGDVYGVVEHQRVEHLPQVQRIAGGPFGQPSQGPAGRGPGQLGDEPVDVVGPERAEREQRAAAGHDLLAQRGHLATVGALAAGGHEQQRHLRDHRREPAPEGQGGLIRVLEIVDHEDQRARGTQLVDQLEQQLGGGRDRVGRAEQPGPWQPEHRLGRRGPQRLGRPRLDPETVQRDPEREPQGQLVGDRPPDVAAGPAGPPHTVGEQGRLADPGLPVEPDGAAPATSDGIDGVAEHTEFVLPADEGTRRAHAKSLVDRRRAGTRL